MKSTSLVKFAVAVLAAGCAASVLAAGNGVDPSIQGSGRIARVPTQVAPAPYPPIENWAAPQFLDFPPGIATSGVFSGGAGGGMKTQSAMTTLAALEMLTFKPVTPCRLVDTRGLFSPVYAGGAFAAGEVRTYTVPGNCGVPSGINRVQAVSLAITTPPTGASGDIEVINASATLGGTVAMVIQAGQWNSVTATPSVNGTGQFKVQLRSTPGDVVIDINGYYAQLDPANLDYFSLTGKCDTCLGMFYVNNSTTSTGGAIHAMNPSSGAKAILATGDGHGMELIGRLVSTGAGVNTNTFAFIHQVTAANLCPNTQYTRIESAFVFGANASSTQMLMTQEVHRTSSGATPKSYNVQFFTGACNGTGQPSWFLYTPGAFAVGEQYNVLVIDAN